MRKLWLIIGIFIILLNISGCFWQKEQDKKETFILYSVVDATGTRLDFEEKPVRIMSMNISIDEVLWEIVEKDRIVALSKLADDPQISSISKEVKNLKGRVSSGNIEQILAYQPDLIIVPDYNMGFIKSLRSLGLKVYVCKTPVNVDEIFTYINKISKVVGEQEKGENLVKELKIKLATITKNVENNIPENKRKKVIVLTSTGLLGSKGTFSDICYYAGVKNCFADEDIMFEGIFPKELLLKVKPDIIMIYKINWSKYVDITPIRYGMLTGYMILPFFGGLLACNYCNFYLFDLFTNYFIWGYFISLTSTLIITTFVWVIILGLFTQGGRGYCNFLCPVGAVQNLIHALGCKFDFVSRINIDKTKCIGCQKCSKVCPMESIKIVQNKAQTNVYNCIICEECVYNCPVKAVSYGKREK